MANTAGRAALGQSLIDGTPTAKEEEQELRQMFEKVAAKCDEISREELVALMKDKERMPDFASTTEVPSF